MLHNEDSAILKICQVICHTQMLPGKQRQLSGVKKPPFNHPVKSHRYRRRCQRQNRSDNKSSLNADVNIDQPHKRWPDGLSQTEHHHVYRHKCRTVLQGSQTRHLGLYAGHIYPMSNAKDSRWQKEKYNARHKGNHQ